MLKVYAYKGCGTCRKAAKWLAENGIAHEEIPIRETPPTKKELRAMLASYSGDLKRIFNTSGGDYRELGIKDQLPGLTPAQVIDLLASNGNLIKRPFVFDPATETGLVGFSETEWKNAFA
ncbi:MAG: arsenate reductase family protein [Verrucomicrobiales bacterium]